MRAESLQRRPPCSFEAFIAAWTITCVAKKIFAAAPCDDPRAPPSGVIVHVQTVAAVLGGERFVLAVSCDRFQTAASAAGFSLVTTAAPSPDIPRCSSAPSDPSVEISFCIPSTNTLGFAADVIAACSVAVGMGVALSAGLTDLDWGLMGGFAPGKLKSRRGLHSSPRRFHQASEIQEFTTGKTLSTLLATFSPPSTRGGLAHSGPPKWPILSPPPTFRTMTERRTRAGFM
jgi:hypothetical protein